MRVVLATCHRYPALTPSDARLRIALEARGAHVSVQPWDGIVPALPSDTRVCLRSTWDYHRRADEFRAWVSAFRGLPGALWNSPETVLWNMDKVYLRDLAAAGIVLPATRWFEPRVRPDVAAFLRDTGHERAVVKPRISATAYGTHLIDAATVLRDAEWQEIEASGCVLQAFVPEVQSRGEISLIYIDGVFAHAMRKVAVEGEFRVQMDFGGRAEPFRPSRALVSLGEAILQAAQRPWIYARVDIVETSTGPVLMELELIEPELFLSGEPASADLFAGALLSATL